MEPQEGAPATEKTEVWLLFDDDNVYVVVPLLGEPSRSGWSPTRCGATATTSSQNDDFGVRVRHVLRPAQRRRLRRQRRSAAAWTGRSPTSGSTTATGTRSGMSRSAGSSGGWTVEAAIPFKSLRYRPGRAQIWGFNARRINRWKNEIVVPHPHPARRWAGGASSRRRWPPRVVGLEAPPGSKNLEIKPYAIVEPDDRSHRARRGSRTTSSGDVGFDVKYGVTQNLTADFTYNTDFAQVEADEQQVNLTRFSLFFPEKREFFLENQGTFAFGGATASDRRTERHADPVLQPPHRPRSTAARCRSTAAAG